LRDVRTDAGRGRIYLPLSELKKFNVSPDEILRHEYSERFAQLAAAVAGRARNFYRLARETLPAEDRRSMAAAELMGSVYWRLLQKLEAKKFNVFDPQPMRLSNGYKTFLILQSWLRFAVGATASNYGPP
jgi:15-cis-phytoene synthase